MKRVDPQPTAKGGVLIQEIAEFGSAVRAYCRVILAMLRREEENRRAAPLSSIFGLLEPVFLVCFMTFFWWFLGARNVSPLGGSPVLFYATGFFILYFFEYISKRMRSVGVAPQRRFPIEQRLDHIIVHVILRALDYTVLGVLIFGTIYVFITADALPNAWIPIAEAVAAAVMLGFGWGVLNLIIGRRFKLWPYIFMGFNRGLIVFSGVFYVAEMMPVHVRYILSFNPLLHIVTLFRMGFYPAHPSLLLDRSYLFACALFSFGLGLMLERVTRRRERS